VVNGYGEEELSRLIYRYGEERFAGRIARSIIKKRAAGPVTTTAELSAIICAAVPFKANRSDRHPAQRTFMALRIEVNSELSALGGTVAAIAGRLARGGRFVVISFHSLEDRIIKNTFAELSGVCTCPPDLPVCACGALRKLVILTKKPAVPTYAEASSNPRARSAKLRAAERI